MGWSAQYFTTIIIEGNTPQTGIFIYNGAPSLGNLIGSWAAAAGTDAFGNSYPAGINVTQGTLQGVGITNAQITATNILSSIISNGTLNNNQINQGQILETTIIFDNGGGVLFGYTSTTTTVTQTVAGDYNFTSPITGTASVTCIAGGAGGDGGFSNEGGSGGGAGECAQEPNYAIVNSQLYLYTVGAGGGGSSTNGGHGIDGGNSVFDTGNGGIVSNGGLGNGTGGTGSTNSVHHDGGAGGASAGGVTGGASGGNSGNTTATGNAGITGSGATGGAQPAAQTGSGRGGAGGNANANGSNGGSPGAGGGGAGSGGSNPTQQSISYAPTWSGSYYGPDGGNPNALRSTSTIWQGGETASGGSFNGNQRNAIAFNRAQIASDFAGYTITGAQVQFKNLHSWYNSGMYIELDEFQGLPGSAPSSYPNGDFRSADATLFINEGATTVYNIATSIAQRFVTGSSNGLGMGHDIATSHPYDLYNYGYFDPTQTRFKITGTIGGSGITNAGNGSDGSVVITYSSASVLEFALSPTAGTDKNSNAFAAGYTGPSNVFDPNASPTAVEVWHSATLANGWAKQGFARYKLIGYNVMLIEVQINDGSATSGVFMTMPTGYSASLSQFPCLAIFNNVAGVPAQGIAIVQVGTGAGANLTILDWAKQNKQFVGQMIISLD